MVQHFSAKCPICYSDLIVVEVSALQCGHTFHYGCIQRWLKESHHCPKCRAWASERNLIKQLYFDSGEQHRSSEETDNEESVVQTMEAVKAGLLREFMDRLKSTEQLLLTRVKKRDSEAKLAQIDLLKAEVDNKVRQMQKTFERYQRRASILTELENRDTRSRNFEFERKLANMERELKELRREATGKQDTDMNEAFVIWGDDVEQSGTASSISLRRGGPLISPVATYRKASSAAGTELEGNNSFNSNVASPGTFFCALQKVTCGRQGVTSLLSQSGRSGCPSKSAKLPLLPNRNGSTENRNSVASLWKEVATSSRRESQAGRSTASRVHSADNEEEETAFHKQYGNCTPLYH